MRQNEEQGNVFENKSPMPLFAVYSSLGGLLSPTETHRELQGRNWRSLGGPTKAHQVFSSSFNPKALYSSSLFNTLG